MITFRKRHLALSELKILVLIVNRPFRILFKRKTCLNMFDQFYLNNFRNIFENHLHTNYKILFIIYRNTILKCSDCL